MRRTLLVFVLLSVVAAGVLAAAWYSGAVEAILISRILRSEAQGNLERQLKTPAGYGGRRPVDLTPFAAELAALDEAREAELDAFLTTATIPDIQARMAAGDLTSTELTTHYLARTKSYDTRLQSVSEIDPQILDAARELDAEREAGHVRGALHGIPVLLKDNIATAGDLHTTAGAAALRELQTGRDAPLVRNLRQAGALILGKAAMSEWANFTARQLPNGFSVVGGQVRNPYGAFDVSGSSSGSAVAVTAGFVTVSVGTETWGSLVSPATQNGVVTIKPSAGLVSNEGVIPVIPSQDTAGPMARSVTDAAILLEALAGAEGAFVDALDAKGLAGLRLGVVGLRREVNEGDNALLARVIQALQGAGAEVVTLPPGSLVDVKAQVDAFTALANHDFVRGVNAFLAETSFPLRTLGDVIGFNDEDPARRVPFGQDRLVDSQEDTMSEAEYLATKARSQARARDEIDRMLADADLDLLLAIGSAFFIPFCAAGYPAANVPAGRRPSGEPVGVTFVGRAGDEALLIRAAFAFEQATLARKPPDLRP